ncbi:MAG: glycosyltransferase family 9 protein [Nitrospira sp.]|nr:glycosyltransferase family 9 protein [Nitrospira sp.]MBH0181424.1 glycosyltransferase family 9 protein [Nitrospira sp.]
MARTIVILHPGALGDIVLAVPAMRRLLARFPQHRSLLISNEPIGRFLLECRMVDGWMPVQGAACADLFVGSVSASTELGHWLKECDCAVAWMNDEGETLATVLRCCGVREMMIQSPFSSELKAMHQGERFLETIGETVGDGSLDGQMQIPSDLVERGQVHLERMGIPFGRPIVLIHPGSGSRRKCVNPEVLALAIEQFQGPDMCPLILEGPADRESVAGLSNLVPAVPVIAGGDLSIVACLLARSVLYIGNDSGMTHLAALLAVPAIALFGPTDPERWAPRGSHVTVLRGAFCTCPSWESVAACSGKPCFAISAEAIVSAGKKIIRSMGTTPRNPSQYALSQPDSCATVPRSFSLSMVTT